MRARRGSPSHGLETQADTRVPAREPARQAKPLKTNGAGGRARTCTPLREGDFKTERKGRRTEVFSIRRPFPCPRVTRSALQSEGYGDTGGDLIREAECGSLLLAPRPARLPARIERPFGPCRFQNRKEESSQVPNKDADVLRTFEPGPPKECLPLGPPLGRFQECRRQSERLSFRKRRLAPLEGGLHRAEQR